MATPHARLEIRPLIKNAETLLGGIQAELPTHAGLTQAATYIVSAAQNAEHVTRRMRSLVSLSRLPSRSFPSRCSR